MKVKLLIEGGDMKPGPSIAQQLGPMGINIGKVISQINLATKDFKGMKVPVELDINEKTKDFIVYTSSPPTSELLKKELSLEKGSNQISSIKIGNASIEDIIKIAKIKHPNMLEKDLKTAVKSILGTSTSVGLLVENENPNELIKKIDRFDKEIQEEKIETSKEKRQKLNQYFNEIKSAQEARIAAEKAAEEVAKAEAEKTATGEVKTTSTEKIGEKKAEVKPEAKTIQKSGKSEKPTEKKK